jgi:hypothetical protein
VCFVVFYSFLSHFCCVSFFLSPSTHSTHKTRVFNVELMNCGVCILFTWYNKFTVVTWFYIILGMMLSARSFYMLIMYILYGFDGWFCVNNMYGVLVFLVVYLATLYTPITQHNNITIVTIIQDKRTRTVIQITPQRQ